MSKLLRNLFLVTTFLLAVLAAAFAWRVWLPLELRQPTVEFTIVPGSSMRVAAQEIATAGVELPPWLLVILGKLLRVDASIKAGSYQVSAGITPLELLRKLTRGDVTQSELTVIEGWTFRQLRQRLDAHPDLAHDTATLSDAEIMQRIDGKDIAAEGLFFPDTYLFAKRSSDLDLLARAFRAMQGHLQREWLARAAGLPYANAYQALIMASIVEKETARAEDRGRIAGVFVNRLRLGMLLQTDPTVIYGLGEQFDGNLRKRDLLADSPYNTYRRSGLPPTPIALPGRAALQAALHPEDTAALYFVARGDGTSEFSRTLAEHQRAVTRYQRGGTP